MTDPRADRGPQDAAAVPGPDRAGPPATAAEARELAGTMARHLARQEVRVSVAIALLERAEAGADAAATRTADAARAVAHAGGVGVPRYVVASGTDGGPVHPAVAEAEEIIRLRAAEIARSARRRRRPAIRVESWVLGLASFVLFVMVGSVAAVGAGILPGDALSRVQAAQSVLSSRDPHLEAIGFIWGPFPTLFQVPLVALRSWWPAITANGLAAVVVSAAFMAGTVVQLVAWGRDAGAPRWFRIAAVVVAVAHPLVWIYGANGMSEACGMFFLVLAARQLARWLETDDVRPLCLCGIALGLAYLARYEAVTAVLAAGVVVGVVSLGRQPRDRSPAERVRGMVVDLAVVALPALAAVVGWALVSWVIVGEPFSQFTSEYGNSALVEASGSGTAAIIGDLSAPGRAWFFIRQVAFAAPLLVGLALGALWVGDRAAARATAALAVVGSPMALQLLLSVQGGTFPWFRYVAGAVTLSVLLALVIGGAPSRTRGRWLRPLALLALVPGVVVATTVVRSGDLGAEDDARFVAGLQGALDGEGPVESRSMVTRGAAVAQAIDQRDGVVPGSVLTDTSSTFAVVAAAPRPDVYLIPSDRDFEAVVSDPATFGVRYLLLHSPATPGDALVRQYPALWNDDGTPIATLVASWGDEQDRVGEYRLYAVDDPAPRPRPTPEDGFSP